MGFLRTWIGSDRVFRTAAWFSLPYNVLALVAIVAMVLKHPWKLTMQYTIYYAVLVGTVLFYANAEINTRVCASCPVLYWIYAKWQLEAEESMLARRKQKQFPRIIDYVKKYGILLYIVVYLVAEMLLVPTFIGWI